MDTKVYVDASNLPFVPLAMWAKEYGLEPYSDSGVMRFRKMQAEPAASFRLIEFEDEHGVTL